MLRRSFLKKCILKYFIRKLEIEVSVEKIMNYGARCYKFTKRAGLAKIQILQKIVTAQRGILQTSLEVRREIANARTLF